MENPVLSSFFKGFKVFTVGTAWIVGGLAVLFGIGTGLFIFSLFGIFSCWCGHSISSSLSKEESNIKEDDDEGPNLPFGTV